MRKISLVLAVFFLVSFGFGFTTPSVFSATTQVVDEVVFLDSNNTIISTMEYLYSPMGDCMGYKSRDKNGNILWTSTCAKEGGITIITTDCGGSISISRLEYDAHDNVVRMESKAGIATMDNEYDSLNRIQKITTHNFDGSYSVKTFTYSEGTITEKTDNNGDGIIDSVVVKKLDSEGRVSQEVHDGFTIVNEYQGGLLIKATTKVGGVTSSVSVYKYKSLTNPPSGGGGTGNDPPAGNGNGNNDPPAKSSDSGDGGGGCFITSLCSSFSSLF